MPSPLLSTAASLRAHAEQVIARCRELASITDVAGETTRTFLSPATRIAQARLTGWMRAAGLEVAIDAIGNLHARRPAAAPGTPRLLIGSHLDTVVNAGAFDGPLGILLGLALIEFCQESAEGSADAWQMPVSIDLAAFSEEEGVRFQQPFLGSLSLIGEPVPDTVTDGRGVTLAQAMRDFGHTSTHPGRLDPAIFGYLEFHIEQGPRLEAEGRPLAAVRAITGYTRLRLTFKGQANHAGTTPMRNRRDSLAAAAQWIVEVEAFALSHAELVATVGFLEAQPGLGNVIASQTAVSLDLRHGDDSMRLAAVEAVIRLAHAAAAHRGVTFTVHPRLDQATVPMSPALTSLLVAAASSSGYDAAPIVSGAGHDAMILARRLPASMLLLRTPGGLSHHPAESVSAEDVEAALATAAAFVSSLSPSTIPLEAYHA